ncbi:MAG: hypothetical protein PVJ07_02945 [Anaerolineales bacterium]
MISRTSDYLSQIRTSERGPLAFVILAATGQDVRLCTNCSTCEHLTSPKMDLSIGELMQAAAANRVRVLSCRTLWNCEELLETPPICHVGLDIAAIIVALQRESLRRGYDSGGGQVNHG